MSYILILGAKSDIAKAIARCYAKHGYDLYLAARNVNTLEQFANDIRIRTEQNVRLLDLDILNFESHHSFYEQLEKKPIGVISAIGYLGEQDIAQKDNIESQKIINTNFTGIANLLNIIADDFEHRKSGFIIGISSVAGDRGRSSNYLYGASKAAFTAYLSGLRNRLCSSQVHVMTVKPGFVATRMTQGMDLPEKLTAQPDEVANTIFNAQQKNRNIIYSKGIWRWIMLIIKMIPEWLFKKMTL